MENNPIETLFDEHDIISGVEAIILKLDRTWEKDANIYRQNVGKLITFFREYADGMHHRKEEEVLFPALRDCPDFIMQDILDELETHHEDFRDYTKEIEEELNNDDFQRAHKALTEYCNDLLDHIGAENDELFVLAESLLEEDELENIYFRFKDIDLEIGEDILEDLVSKIEEI